MGWRQKALVAVLTIVVGVLAVSAMGLILLHMRPLTPDRIEMHDLE
jgi:hypothetical protein